MRIKVLLSLKTGFVKTNFFGPSGIGAPKTSKKAISADDYMLFLQRKILRGWTSRKMFSNLSGM